MKSAITVSLVPEALGGPFVFWNGLEDAFLRAARLGFDAVEIFAPDAGALDAGEIRELMERHGLAVAAVGTGAGWVKHKLHLCHADRDLRMRARAYLLEMVEAGARLGAPAVLGSMQGRVEPGVEREQALDWLAEALQEAGEAASARGTFFLYEPLNRYETNIFNRQLDAAAFVAQRGGAHVRILADLFHMNMEESDLPAVLRELGAALGHVHFADSNRRAVGFGHTRMPPVLEALESIGYAGYLCAEVLPLPDADSAAERTIRSFRELLS